MVSEQNQPVGPGNIPLGLFPLGNGKFEHNVRVECEHVILENGQKKITKLRFYGRNGLLKTIEDEDKLGPFQILSNFPEEALTISATLEPTRLNGPAQLLGSLEKGSM